MCTEASSRFTRMSAGWFRIHTPAIAAATHTAPTLQRMIFSVSLRLCLCQMASNSTPSSFVINCIYARSLFSHPHLKIFSWMLAPRISGMPSSFNTGLKHSVSGFPLCGSPSTMKKWMFFSRPRLWKYAISCATHFERADAGEQMTIRFLEARSLACSSSVSPPG